MTNLAELPKWKKSTRCESHTCVEVAAPPSRANASSRTLVRDGKLGNDSPVLAFSPASWTAFVANLS